jgi:outer membrane assembly lipoprotein YfiO
MNDALLQLPVFFRRLRFLLIISLLLLSSCTTVGSAAKKVAELWPFGSGEDDSSKLEPLDSVSEKTDINETESPSEENKDLVEESELEELSRKDGVKIDEETQEGSQTLRVVRALEKAQDYFSRELYTLARAKFEAIRQIDRSSAYRDYIEIKLADCSLYTGEYETAANEYTTFVDAHPESSMVPYALFNAGQALQLSNPGAGRDPSGLYRAQELFSKLVHQHPTSGYSRLALEHFITTEDDLKAHRDKIIGFYDNLDLSTALHARMSSTHLEEQTTLASVTEMQTLLTKNNAPIVHPLGRSPMER